MSGKAIVKYEDEEIPLLFDFTTRLGALAPGARISEVLELSVTPTGDSDDLNIGVVGDAAIDEVSELMVQVRAIKGRASVRAYSARCKATVVHAGTTYPLIVVLPVYVRA